MPKSGSFSFSFHFYFLSPPCPFLPLSALVPFSCIWFKYFISVYPICLETWSVQLLCIFVHESHHMNSTHVSRNLHSRCAESFPICLCCILGSLTMVKTENEAIYLMPITMVVSCVCVKKYFDWSMVVSCMYTG